MFCRKAGAAKETLCKEDETSKKEATDPPKIIEKDPAKPVSGTNWTESKPRMKIQGGDHIQRVITQSCINNDSNNLFL